MGHYDPELMIRLANSLELAGFDPNEVAQFAGCIQLYAIREALSHKCWIVQTDPPAIPEMNRIVPKHMWVKNSNDPLYPSKLMADLENALHSTRFSQGDVARLWAGNGLAEIRNGLRQKDWGIIIDPVVDLDADPFVPEGWQVRTHYPCGKFRFDPAAVKLYLTEQQKTENFHLSDELEVLLGGKGAYNANLLDFYLLHPKLIPLEWRGKEVFFWSTTYFYSDGLPFVRCLFWDGTKWRDNRVRRFKNASFRRKHPAAVKIGSFA